MLICRFCGESGTLEDGVFQLDTYTQRGFWCELCDGYTYFDNIEVNHRFTLILEEKVNKSKIALKPIRKFSKQLSPYRYPGGKSKLIDYLYLHLQQAKTKTLISPFTGGGSFELAMLDAGVVEHLHMNDLDFGVYSFWWLVKHMPYELIERIRTTKPNHKSYFKAQELIKNDYLGADMIEAAWASLFVNRLAYSGIFKANPLGGKKGSVADLVSRWNPDSLIKRVERIHAMSDRMEITNQNAVDFIEESYWLSNATIFIDPPYVEKGPDLYHCYYSNKDHIELAVLLDSLFHGCPGADIIVTYDYNQWLCDLYEMPEVEVIGRVYSI